MGFLDNLGVGAEVVSSGTNIAGGMVDLFTRKKRREEQYDREDTAVQRRAADLEAAGLSKTLAAGSAASAAPVTQRSTQTKTGISQAVLANAQKELTNQKINESKTQEDLNRALASKANTEAGNLVLLRPKIGSESTLAQDKATYVPQEREAFANIGWSYYKDAPGHITGEIARTLSSFAAGTTGLTKTVLEKLQPVAQELQTRTFETIEQGNNWIQEQIDKIPGLFGQAKEGVREIFKDAFRRRQ